MSNGLLVFACPQGIRATAGQGGLMFKAPPPSPTLATKVIPWPDGRDANEECWTKEGLPEQHVVPWLEQEGVHASKQGTDGLPCNWRN